MNRRQFVCLTTAALASRALTARAEASNPPRVGWIWSGRSSYNPNEVKGFRQGLLDLGYVESQNILVAAGHGHEDPHRWGDQPPRSAHG
jgi:hypothetical protein